MMFRGSSLAVIIKRRVGQRAYEILTLLLSPDALMKIRCCCCYCAQARKKPRLVNLVLEFSRADALFTFRTNLQASSQLQVENDKLRGSAGADFVLSAVLLLAKFAN